MNYSEKILNNFKLNKSVFSLLKPIKYTSNFTISKKGKIIKDSNKQIFYKISKYYKHISVFTNENKYVCNLDELIIAVHNYCLENDNINCNFKYKLVCDISKQNITKDEKTFDIIIPNFNLCEYIKCDVELVNHICQKDKSEKNNIYKDIINVYKNDIYSMRLNHMLYLQLDENESISLNNLTHITNTARVKINDLEYLIKTIVQRDSLVLYEKYFEVKKIINTNTEEIKNLIIDLVNILSDKQEKYKINVQRSFSSYMYSYSLKKIYDSNNYSEIKKFPVFIKINNSFDQYYEIKVAKSNISKAHFKRCFMKNICNIINKRLNLNLNMTSLIEFNKSLKITHNMLHKIIKDKIKEIPNYESLIKTTLLNYNENYKYDILDTINNYFDINLSFEELNTLLFMDEYISENTLMYYMYSKNLNNNALNKIYTQEAESYIKSLNKHNVMSILQSENKEEKEKLLSDARKNMLKIHSRKFLMEFVNSKFCKNCDINNNILLKEFYKILLGVLLGKIDIVESTIEDNVELYKKFCMDAQDEENETKVLNNLETTPFNNDTTLYYLKDYENATNDEEINKLISSITHNTPSINLEEIDLIEKCINKSRNDFCLDENITKEKDLESNIEKIKEYYDVCNKNYSDILSRNIYYKTSNDETYYELENYNNFVSSIEEYNEKIADKELLCYQPMFEKHFKMSNNSLYFPSFAKTFVSVPKLVINGFVKTINFDSVNKDMFVLRLNTMYDENNNELRIKFNKMK